MKDERMLLSNFNLLATAPGGVARLRELILTLAVQGKLVPQDPSDEPASVLLQKIRVEKDRLIEEGKIRRDKPLAAISDEEKPFELPVGWEWVRLPEIYYSISPSSNKLLSSKVLDAGLFPVVDQGQRYIAGYTNEKSLLINIPGPVIVFGDHTKEIKHIAFDFVAGADGTKILRPVQQDEKFFEYQLRSFRLEDRGYARHFKVLNVQLFALPPLPEQSHIVTRVEELMRVCDALEVKGKLEAAQHAELVSNLLGTLTKSDTPEALAENWQRIATHFDLLLDRPRAIDAFEQTILQLAVYGLLVSQDPSDEPASVLIQKIRADKDRLMGEGRIKRDKHLPPIEDAEKPFELPAGWEWVRLNEVWQSSFYGPRFSNDEYVTQGGIPTIRTTDMTDGVIHLKSPPRVNVPLSKYEDYLVKKGDILVTRSGSIGVMALFDLELDAVPSAYLIRLRFSDLMLPEYCFKFFLSTLGQSQLGLSTTSVGVPNVSASKMAEFIFPLPPFAEQSRIVTRVEELRRLCAELRQRLSASQTTQAHLTEALVESVAG